MTESRYTAASSDAPCYGCGKTDWCTTTTDGRTVFCRRGTREGGLRKTDKHGAEYWLYRPDGKPSRRGGKSEKPVVERAPADDLNQVYGYLLDILPLAASHREILQNRGLNDEDIDRREYRSLPIGGRPELAQQVVDFLGSELCAHVPGWYIKDGSWGLAGAAGTLIPVRDLKNRIIALKVRADDGDGPKYSNVSSYNHGGAGAGAHIHVPLFDGDCSTVRVTEGELKADVATSLSGILTLGLPGVTNYRQVIPVLKDLGASTVLLAIDADAREKKHVARAMAGLAKDLSEAD